MRNLLFLCLLPNIAFADLPIGLDDILTDKGKLKIDLAVTYANFEQSRTEFATPVLVQTGANSFIAIPTALGESTYNSDMLIGIFGLRYGMTGNTDIYGHTAYLWQESRQFGVSGSHSQQDNRLANLSLGISHTFLKDEKNPALIGFGAVAGASFGPAVVIWTFNGALAKGMTTGVAKKYGW